MHTLWRAAALLAAAACLLCGCAAHRAAQPAAAGEEAAATLSFTPPAGFTQAQEGLYRSPDYPDDASCITLAVLPADPYFADYTADTLAGALSAAVSQQCGQPVQVALEQLSYYEIGGFAARRAQVRYTAWDTDVCQLILSVDAGVTYRLIFTQVGDAQWSASYAAAADSVQLTVPDEAPAPGAAASATAGHRR